MPTQIPATLGAFPALLSAAVFSTGIILADALGPPLLVWALLLGCAGILTTLIAAGRLISAKRLVLTLCALISLLSVGGLRHESFFSIPSNHLLFNGAGGEVTVTGLVAGTPTARATGYRFVLDVDSITVGATARHATGRIQVSTFVTDPGTASTDNVHVCDRVRIRGELELPSAARNPGDFDYRKYLLRRRIHLMIQTSIREVAVVGSTSSGLTCTAGDLREDIRNRLRRHIGDDRALGIVEALILGDRHGVDRETIQKFTRTGILHLLAVSGLHVVIVGMILYQLLRPSLMRLGLSWRSVEITRTIATTVLLIVYMMITGGSPSVVRAVVMTLLIMGASTFQRTTHPLNTLGAAAVAILAANPSHLFEPGFQLSFAAVGAIVTLTPRPTSSGVLQHVVSSFAVTAAATLGTLPIVLHHFGRVSLGGLLLNLVGVPVTSVALAAGVATVVSTIVSASAAAVLGGATEFLVRVLLYVADSGDRLIGWTYLHWNIEHVWDTTAIALTIVVIAIWKRPRLRWRMLVVTFTFVSGLLWIRVAGGFWKPHLDIIFLDVGQGDAILIRLPNGRALLVDAGVRSPFRDTGASVILPVLESISVDRIHTAIITHPDSDHLGGIPSILRSLPVGRLLDNGSPHPSTLFKETTALIDSLEVPRRALRSGDTLSIDSSVRILVLHPALIDSAADPNDNSIVLQVVYGHTAFLLMGDATSSAELVMMRKYDELLKADLVKAGHHGSSTSSSEAFLSHIRERGAQTAIISVALRNRYGLPDESVMRRLDSAGFTTLSTSSEGAIWMRSNGSRVYRNDWRR